jgi:endonuclease III
MGDNRQRFFFNRSGALWAKPRAIRNRVVEDVCRTLTETYGTPRFGNPADPLDDLLFIILSNKTNATTAGRTYQRLRNRFPTWDAILRAPASALRSVLKPSGLSAVKSRQIRAALRRIKEEFHACNLDALRRVSLSAAEKYLVGLPGVSEKVAKCVMMYTLGMPVLPVDTHVHRISSRLGWTARKRADQCHAELEALIRPSLRLNFHVACIAHGREICRPLSPRCESCPISRYCEFFRAMQ